MTIEQLLQTLQDGGLCAWRVCACAVFVTSVDRAVLTQFFAEKEPGQSVLIIEQTGGCRVEIV